MTQKPSGIGLALTILAALACGQVRRPQASPSDLSALEKAYQAGVLTREEVDAKRRELSGPPSGPVTAAGWQSYRDPRGLELEIPAGWRPEATGEAGIVVRGPDGKSVAAAAPFLGANKNCREYLTYAASRPGLFQTTRIDNMVQRRQRPDDTVVASLTANGGDLRGAALCSLYRGSGMLFVIAAPARDFENQRSNLVRIIRSLKFTAPAGAGVSRQAAPAVRYVRFTDPSEGAFTIDVPAGWRVRGGLMRRTAIDVTGSIKMDDPDGLTSIFLGDERLYHAITPELVGGSLREGQLYNNLATQLIVMRYQPPRTFAGSYLPQIQQFYGLSGIQVVNQTELQPERLSSAMGPAQNLGLDVSFKAQRQGRPVAGFLRVVIQSTQVSMANGMYWTPYVFGWVAPLEHAAATAAIVHHSISSGKANPDWVARQQGTTMATSSAFTASSQAINDTITQSYWSRQAAYDRAFTRDSDARRDLVRLRDPNTGEEFTVASGYNYYYRPAGGDERTIFGTDNTDRPNIDATELMMVR